MTTDDEPEGVAHIAGVATQFDGRLRQRCQWCGFMLIDVEETMVGYQLCGEPTVEGERGETAGSCGRVHGHKGMHTDDAPPEDFRYPTWTQGGFVFVSDARNPQGSWTVEWEDGTQVPANACLRLPYELTGSSTD